MIVQINVSAGLSQKIRSDHNEKAKQIYETMKGVGFKEDVYQDKETKNYWTMRSRSDVVQSPTSCLMHGVHYFCVFTKNPAPRPPKPPPPLFAPKPPEI